jgi:hypothetical protein
LAQDGKLVISVKQLMDIAIVPVIKQLVSTLVSGLLDTNLFGHYDINTLFVTGGCFKTSEFNDIYHHLIVSEFRRELKRLLNSIKIEIEIHTSRQHAPLSDKPGYKSFCYDIFSKGELCKVSPTTYFLGSIYTQQQEVDRSNTIFQGNRLIDQSITLNIIRDFSQLFSQRKLYIY